MGVIMYKDEIRDTMSQIREYNLYFFNECLSIYIKLLFTFPENRELRKQLWLFANNYFSHFKLEKEILLHIKKQFGNDDELLEIDEVLDNLDQIFFHYFNYNEYIFTGFDDAMETREPLRATIVDRHFEIIDDNYRDEVINSLVKSIK